MRERSILFSGLEVRAILLDTKTQTRQPRGLEEINRNPGAWGLHLVGPLGIYCKPSARGKLGAYFHSEQMEPGVLSICPVVCPYGQPGDRLWVRETWGAADLFYQEHELDTPRVIAYRADLSALNHSCNPPTTPASYDIEQWNWQRVKWRQSIHMPRWASRITLELLSVRVERLQEISEGDARAEGMLFHDGRSVGHSGWRHDQAHDTVYGTAREAFFVAWEQINGKRSPLASNPWCWVLEFRRGLT